MMKETLLQYCIQTLKRHIHDRSMVIVERKTAIAMMGNEYQECKAEISDYKPLYYLR